MDIILIKDVDGVGFRGQTVKVADGFARNFLIPRGQALRATPAARKVADELNRAAERKEVHVRAEAETRSARLKDVSLTFEMNAGEGGKLFGSVTSQDIAEALAKENTGVEIDKKDVMLRTPIKSVGRFDVKLKIFRDIQPEIEVWVVAKNEAKAPAPVLETSPPAEAVDGAEPATDGSQDTGDGDAETS